MRVLHVIDSLLREYGGTPGVVVRLAVAQAAAGLQPTIACRMDRRLKEDIQWWASQVLGFSAVEVVPCDMNLLSLRRLVRRFDVVHVHGVWTTLPTLACWQAERSGVPTILAPHGMLSGWSLEQRRLRKKASLAIFWRRLISGAAVLHALNQSEAEELRARFPGPVVSIIPNGIFTEEFSDLPAQGESSRLIPALANGRRYILFLARLHFMKAPDLLVDAFARLVTQVPDVDLVIAGPDYGAGAELRHQIHRLGLDSRVHLPGAVYGRAKLALLKDALCMCQPSRHEGFSVSMLEALACGLPVVTTRTANFPEIEIEQAGFISNPDPDALAAAIFALATDANLQQRQSSAARQMVSRTYTWQAVQHSALEVYVSAIASSGETGCG